MILHIIHLPERQDRLVLLKAELEQQNIQNFRIWEGVRNIENPKKGISIAHKKIVQFARETQLPAVLIGEDDLKFTATGAFDFFLRNIPQNYDIYLAGIIYGKLKPDNSVDDFSGTMLYVLHQRFYDIFLSIPEDQHLDRALALKGKYIVCNPMAAIQHNGYSDNSKRYYNYEPYVRNRRLYGIKSENQGSE